MKITFFYFQTSTFNMTSESSFLEADSFLDLPPLRQVDKSLQLHLISNKVLVDQYGNVVETSEIGRLQTPKKALSNHISVFLTETQVIVLDRKFHRILVVAILDEDPFLSKSSTYKNVSETCITGITASHMLGLPMSNMVVLAGMKIAGLVQTKSKKGELFAKGDPQLGFKNAVKYNLDIFSYCSHFNFFFLTFLEGCCFILEVYQGHDASLCKVSTPTDKNPRFESKKLKDLPKKHLLKQHLLGLPVFALISMIFYQLGTNLYTMELVNFKHAKKMNFLK